MGIATDSLSADTRLSILKSLPLKAIQIPCTDAVMDTLFFANSSMPFANPESALTGALSAYWHMLDRASRLFSSSEWRLLAGQHSPFADTRLSDVRPQEIVRLTAEQFAGEDWCEEMLAIKSLLPRLEVLSETEFAAVSEVLRYLRCLDSEDPVSDLGMKLPALEREP